MKSEQLYIKENVVASLPLGGRALAAAWASLVLVMAGATFIDRALPTPLTRDAAPPHRFIAQNAHEHLVNLTSIGPRVAGSYENDVLAVAVVVEAVKRIARGAAPHVRVELDVQTVSGAFPLTFLDGINHVYQDVSNVVARVSAAGGGGGAGGVSHRSALLLNCHIDTVPDSPGASDDGAGCAVLLETLRALAAGSSPPRHDAVFLFNAAEENVLQASHGFITQHKWAKSVRAFINIEACGAGGREVLFQAGPHHPWIVEMYAGAVPHPFASSLAQELFESGLVPADTDFRIFRDFGKLSGVDLAWSANGYVYHTALDTAERVPPAVLQRTGDNVLALVYGMLASSQLESAAEADERQPVFFDVVGLVVVSARAPAALLAAALALALVLLDVHLAATRARDQLFVQRGAWWACVARGAALWAAAGGAGLAAACGVAASLHAADARLTFYSRPWLAGGLYAAPALAGAWATALAGGRRLHVGGLRARGWWPATALRQGGTCCAALAMAVCVARGLRSGFLPWLWAAMPAAAGCLRSLTEGGRGAPAPAWWWAGGALLPALQTSYLAVGSLRMFVPVTGRAGSGAVPAEVPLAALTALLALGAGSWLLPLALAARATAVRRVVAALAATCALTCLLACCGDASAPYSPITPQRIMVFHTRRTVHASAAAGRDLPVTDTFFWAPQLDANTLRTLRKYGGLEAARLASDAECSRWPYCGAPYYLPVMGLLGAPLTAPAATAPRVRVTPALHVTDLNGTHAEVSVTLGRGAAHATVVVSPGAGARVSWSSAVAVPLAGPDNLYFFAVHSARRAPAPLRLVLTRSGGMGAARGTRLAVAGHALFGADRLAEEHARLLRGMPPWVAPTGWGADLHLYRF